MITRRHEDERAAPSASISVVLLGTVRDVERAIKLAQSQADGPRILGVLHPEPDASDPGHAPVLGRVGDFVAGAPLGVAPDLLVVVTPLSSRDEARQLLSAATRVGVPLRFAKRAGGRLGVRPLALSDVIGPPRGAVDWARVRDAMAGKRILVTGGAGSIGGELVRRLLGLAPAHVAVLDNSEFNLFSIAQDIAAAGDAAPSTAVRYADIRDGDSIRRLMAAERPDIVFHAAAMKHVPIVEMNPSEGVLTNVLGARNVADAAYEVGANLVFVSTDKAANPMSVMGATKRLLELYCQARDRASLGPRQLVARLGNVLGSAGSVAPLFDRQIAAGGPVTVTHPDVARFFITIRQAAEFLLDAAAVGLAPDLRGAALVLDMGDPVPVQELARDMIRLRGFEPDRDIEVKFVGLRPGEKLREELIGDDESVAATASPSVQAATSPAVTLADMSRRLDRLIAAARTRSDETVRAMVHELAAPGAKVRVVG